MGPRLTRVVGLGRFGVSPTLSPCSQESYPAVPPIWSVESDDPNLAAILERLVEVRKGNTLVRGQLRGEGVTRGRLLPQCLR